MSVEYSSFKAGTLSLCIFCVMTEISCFAAANVENQMRVLKYNHACLPTSVGHIIKLILTNVMV